MQDDITQLTQELAEQFRVFRMAHKPQTPYPIKLWEKAVEIASQAGVSRTARALRVDYMSLKRRLGPGQPPERVRSCWEHSHFHAAAKDHREWGSRTVLTYLSQRPEISDLGLYLMGQRWYSPAIGRWLSPDPKGFRGGLNRFVYASNSPINFVDPRGLAPTSVFQDPIYLGAYNMLSYAQESTINSLIMSGKLTFVTMGDLGQSKRQQYVKLNNKLLNSEPQCISELPENQQDFYLETKLAGVLVHELTHYNEASGLTKNQTERLAYNAEIAFYTQEEEGNVPAWQLNILELLIAQATEVEQRVVGH